MTVRRTDRQTTVPPRTAWPEAPPLGPEADAVTAIVLATFRLNSRLLEAAQEMAAAGGISAAWWQVLGGVLDRPRTVAEIGRVMGMTRQGVLRVANLLVEHGLAEYRPNPAHRRAHLLACTEAGRWAIRQISLEQHPWAERVGAAFELSELQTTLSTMQRLIVTLEAGQPDGEGHRGSSTAMPIAPTARARSGA